MPIQFPFIPTPHTKKRKRYAFLGIDPDVDGSDPTIMLVSGLDVDEPGAED